MVGKIRPQKIIMPSELTSQKRQKRSKPVIQYNLRQIEDELLESLFPSENRKRLGIDYESKEANAVNQKSTVEEERTVESNSTMDGEVETPGRETPDLKSLPMREQRRILVKEVRAGRSDEAIGDRFDLSQWQVRNLRYKLGIKKDRGGNLRLVPPQTETNSNSNPALQSGGGSQGLDEVREGLRVAFGAEIESDDLATRLEGLANLVDTMGGTFEASVRIQQLADRSE